MSAARVLAKEAGFCAVDIRSCHGYLINELFSAVERKGKYGGSFENRIRFLLNVIDKIKSATDIEIAVRLNVYDGIPYPCGWGADTNNVCVQDMLEPLRLIGLLVQRGVRLIDISAGVGAYSPHVLRPYDRGGAVPAEHPLEGIERMLQSAKIVKQNFPDALVVASAFSWLREYAPMIAAGGIEQEWFDIAGFARQAVAYPNFAGDMLSDKGMERGKCCTTCGGCSGLIKSGKMLRCIVHGKEGIKINCVK